MPRFSYSAVTDRAIPRRGSREASSAAALTDSLRSEGLFVLAVEPAASRTLTEGIRRRWSTRALLDTTRTIATLLAAGLSLPKALLAASRLAGDSEREELLDIHSRVERGERLASALEAQEGRFPAYYVGMVRTGERSGGLTEAFEGLAAQLEREEQIRERLLSALLYPAILALAGGSAMAVLLLVVLPNFAELLQDSGAQLPGSTAFVLGVSGVLRRYWLVIPPLALTLVVAHAWIRSRPAGREAVAKVVDRLPLAGRLVRESSAARFARTTGTLLAAGAPLLSALDDAVASTTAPLTRAAAVRIRGAVRDGAALHQSMRAEAAFPELLTQLTALGEESARLGEFLLKAARLFEERTERSAHRLVALAEPAMIVIFGGIIGFVALSLLQAIYSVNTGSFR